MRVSSYSSCFAFEAQAASLCVQPSGFGDSNSKAKVSSAGQISCGLLGKSRSTTLVALLDQDLGTSRGEREARQPAGAGETSPGAWGTADGPHGFSRRSKGARGLVRGGKGSQLESGSPVPQGHSGSLAAVPSFGIRQPSPRVHFRKLFAEYRKKGAKCQNPEYVLSEMVARGARSSHRTASGATFATFRAALASRSLSFSLGHRAVWKGLVLRRIYESHSTQYGKLVCFELLKLVSTVPFAVSCSVLPRKKSGDEQVKASCNSEALRECLYQPESSISRGPRAFHNCLN